VAIVLFTVYHTFPSVDHIRNRRHNWKNKMNSHLRLIGDVHGHKQRYLQLCRKATHTIQLGDHGFSYDHLTGLSPSQHKILGGNHDNYDEITNWPHYLGNYGVHHVPKIGCIFFIRGGSSLDRQFRTEGIDWWPDEEMLTRRCLEALSLYESSRPSFVVSHECPLNIIPSLNLSGRAIKTRTNQLLGQMFSIHQPKMWVFAHYHTSLRLYVNGTEFVCLDELECFDFRRT